MSSASTDINASTINQEISDLSAGDRVAWIHQNLGNKAVASTSFGLQAAVMLKLISEHAPDMPVIFVDTGYNFPETYRYIDSLTDILDVNLKYYSSRYTPAQQEARWGKRWEKGSDELLTYAKLNKIEPMNRALKDHSAMVWLSGIRRSQSSSRVNRDFAEEQGSTVKAYPILDWPDIQVEHFMNQHDLPAHPLSKKGYVTMGDWHSTRPLENNVSAEETRFGGEKYECGLHIESEDSDFQI